MSKQQQKKEQTKKQNQKRLVEEEEEEEQYEESEEYDDDEDVEIVEPQSDEYDEDENEDECDKEENDEEDYETEGEKDTKYDEKQRSLISKTENFSSPFDNLFKEHQRNSNQLNNKIKLLTDMNKALLEIIQSGVFTKSEQKCFYALFKDEVVLGCGFLKHMERIHQKLKEAWQFKKNLMQDYEKKKLLKESIKKTWLKSLDDSRNDIEKIKTSIQFYRLKLESFIQNQT